MRIRTRSFVIMVSQGLTQAATILVGIILVRMVTQETFGTYRQVLLVYMFLTGLLSLQLELSLYYFLPKYDVAMRRTLLLQTVLVNLAASLLVTVIMLVGAGRISRLFNNPELAPLLRVFCLYPIVVGITQLVPPFMISLDRATRAGFYSIFNALGRAGPVVIVLALGYDLLTVMWAVVAAEGIIAVIGAWDMARFCPEGKWELNRGLIVEQFSYTWPLLTTSVIGIVNIQLDKLLISSFFDPARYAVYSCGAMELPLVALLTKSVNSAMMPNLVVLAETGKRKESLDLWHEAIRKCSLIIFPCFVFFMLAGEDFIVFLYGREYSMASWPFRVYLCMLPVRIATYATLFRAFGKTKVIAVSAAAALCTNAVFSTSLSYLGGQTLLGFLGPSLGAVVSNFVSVACLLVVLRRSLGIPLSQTMRWKELGWTLSMCVGCGLASFIVPLPGLPVAVALFVRASLFMVILGCAFLATGMLKPDEREILRMPWRMLRRVLPARLL